MSFVFTKKKFRFYDNLDESAFKQCDKLCYFMTSANKNYSFFVVRLFTLLKQTLLGGNGLKLSVDLNVTINGSR